MIREITIQIDDQMIHLNPEKDDVEACHAAALALNNRLNEVIDLVNRLSVLYVAHGLDGWTVELQQPLDKCAAQLLRALMQAYR